MPLPSVVLNVKSSLSIKCHLSEPEIYIILALFVTLAVRDHEDDLIQNIVRL